MKAPSFAYSRPASLADAYALLARHGDNARVLAGGQSLIASLNMRLSAPTMLVDITGISGLDTVSVRGERLVIGALARHRAIEQSELVRTHVPLLSEAAPHIAHVAIRNAGTFGGSVAMADPAAEWPACCLALGADIVIGSAGGERRVAAEAFFKGLYETALMPGEIVTAVEIPLAPAARRSVFLELVRRRGDYAIVGLAVLATPGRDGLGDVRIAFLGVGSTPVLATHAMAALEGQRVTPESIRAAQQALGSDLDPLADLYNSAAMKLHLARVLLGRALGAIGS